MPCRYFLYKEDNLVYLESEALIMFEAISLVIFAGVMYFCLVIAPSAVEFLGSEEFKKSYLAHLASEHLTTFGK